MIAVVLDTSVLVSANLNAEGIEYLVVSLALNGRIQLYVSEVVLAEYERVLLYPRLKFNPKEVSKFMALVRRAATLVKPTRTVTESSDDADNRFFECAETAAAGFLVTGKKRHFPNRWKKTQIVNAREFFRAIGDGFLN